MKSSLGKLGRKLTMHKTDAKEKKDHQPSAHLDELAQASKDMQDMRNCYDSLLSAAAATTNSIYEFSESLHEMGTCLLEKTTMDSDGESGRVLSTLGNMQSELQKIADTYRSYIILTITNPSESLLSELRKVEEMKLQCDEKREAYDYMMTQYREKGRLRSGKIESSIAQKLQEAQDEYGEMTRLCVFRVKSLKEGQCRSLLTQAARHHAAQLNFFRKGLKTLEAVDPYVRIVAEKHHIDYQLSGLDEQEAGVGEGMSSYESTDDGELSFDYRQKKQGLDNVGTSSNQMELDRVDITYPQVSTLEDSENVYKYQGEHLFGRQNRVSSYSAPIYPEKSDPSGRLREMQPPRKFNSYVLPPPVIVADPKSPISRTPTTSPFQQPRAVDHNKHDREFGEDHTSTSASTRGPSAKDINGTNQLPAPSAERFSLQQWDSSHSSGNALDNNNKGAKRQAYSGPLPPSKPFSGKIVSSSGPIELPQVVPATAAAPSMSPPPLSSPKISELHELPRPPPFSKPPANVGHSAPLFFKNQDPPNNKSPTPTPSPLPPPPLVVPRSFSIPSSSQRAMALHVAKLMDSPQITRGNLPEVASPPLTPISLSTVSQVATDSPHL